MDGTDNMGTGTQIRARVAVLELGASVPLSVF